MKSPNISDSVKVTVIKPNQAEAGTEINTDSVDMAGFDGVVFVGSLDTANAGNSVNISQSSNDTDFEDLEGTRVTPSTDGEEVAIELVRPRKRYVRARINRSGADTATQTFFAIRYNMQKSLGPSPGLVSVSSPQIEAAVEEYLWGLPEDRSWDWANTVGVQGDIPETVDFADLVDDYSAPTNGTSDCRAAFEAAIAACPAGQAITIPAGVFTIDGGGVLDIRFCHLKGAGRALTQVILKNGARLRIYGNSGFPNQIYTITGGPQGTSGVILRKGDQWVDVDDASGIGVGNRVYLLEEDDGVVVNPTGDEGTWSPRGLVPTRNKEENMVVASIEGNRIHFVDPTPHEWSMARNVYLGYDSVTAKYAGISGMKLGGPDKDDQPEYGVLISQAANCWLEDIEFQWIERESIYLRDAVRITIRKCDGHDNYWLTNSGGYGIRMDMGPSHCLIEDGYWAAMRSPGIICSGGTGNVFSYLYCDFPIHETQSIQQHGIVYHACYPSYNLVEGCKSGLRVGADWIHGNNAYNGFFRNQLLGASADARTTIEPTRYRLAANVDKDCLYYWFVGNLMGQSLNDPDYEAENQIITDTEEFEYRLGYTTDGDTGPAENDAAVKATLYRHANYSSALDEVVYEDGEIQNLPDSLYLTEKPSWWGASEWPPFTPEGAGAAEIPAETRFIANGGRAGLGVAQFDSLIPLGSLATPQKVHDVAYDSASGVAVVAYDFLGLMLISVSEIGEIATLDTHDPRAGFANCVAVEKIGAWYAAGGSDGNLDIVSVSGSTIVEEGNVDLGTESIASIATDGTIGAACARLNGLKTFTIDGGGAPTVADTYNPADHFCYAAAFASGSNIYASMRNNLSGDSYVWVATHVAGVMTEVEKIVIGTPTPYPIGLAATDDNVYVTHSGNKIARYSRGVNGALTFEEDYDIDNDGARIQIRGSRLWVPSIANDIISFEIQGDGTLVESSRTDGITDTEAGDGSESIYIQAAGFNGLRTWGLPA